MRKIVTFFLGLLILALMLGAIAGAAAIYDAARNIKIETYFFQPNNLSGRRVGVPATVADLGADKIRQMLVEKYLTEYFYVIPDVANIEARMQSNSTLARMSTPDVFRQWQELEGELILKLAEEGACRTVRLVGDENMMDFRQNLDVAKYLEEGQDPAAIFRFGITAIGRQMD